MTSVSSHKPLRVIAVVFTLLVAVAQAQTYFNPTMQLNHNLDAIPDGPYRVGYKTSKHFDPNGYHASETYNEFGQLLPTLSKHFGRNIGYDHVYPVLANIHQCHAPQTYWNTAVSYWTAQNSTIRNTCEHAPLANDERHAVIMFPNGFQDGSNEYFSWAYKLATYGYYIKAVQWHSGDEVLHAYNDRELILVERVKDVVNGLNDLLDSDDLPYLDTSRIGCAAHSYGGAACLDLNVAVYSRAPDLRFNFILSLDASAYAFSYDQLTPLNIAIIGLYAENDIEDQGAIRVRNANQHPVNHHIVMVGMPHQEFQIENCAQSLLAIATGQVNTVPAAVPWKFPGQMFSRWCTLPSLWPENPALMPPAQTVFNTGIYWLVSFLKAFVNADVIESADYQQRFTLKNVTAFQATANSNVYSPFNFLTARKCGNLNWNGIPISPPVSSISAANSLTPIELTRTEAKIYTYYSGENVTEFSGSYLITPGIYSDCAAQCPFFGTTGTDNEGNPTVVINQPDRFVMAANPQCGCYYQPDQC